MARTSCFLTAVYAVEWLNRSLLIKDDLCPFLYSLILSFFFLEKLMSLSTVTESGYAIVAKEREAPGVKIYYELHGNGPENVVLIMGKQ